MIQRAYYNCLAPAFISETNIETHIEIDIETKKIRL